jgi:hypothetical protein
MGAGGSYRKVLAMSLEESTWVEGIESEHGQRRRKIPGEGFQLRLAYLPTASVAVQFYTLRRIRQGGSNDATSHQSDSVKLLQTSGPDLIGRAKFDKNSDVPQIHP